MSPTLLILLIIGLIAVWLIFTYNSLITLKNRVAEAWSDIEIQLKRRHNLIPNLVKTVQGYAHHERQLFKEVTAARTRAETATSLADKATAEEQLSKALFSLLAVAENYPELKASQNFLALQDELTDTENKIQAARRFYNTNVRDFNTKLQTFPTNIIARQLGFRPYDFFELKDEKARQPVEVKFE